MKKILYIFVLILSILSGCTLQGEYDFYDFDYEMSPVAVDVKIGNSYGNFNSMSSVVSSSDWIYYRNGYDNSYLYKMKNDGSKKIRVSNESVGAISAFNDYIYYVKNNVLHRLKFDGNNFIEYSIKDIYNVFIAGDWIYFSVYKDSRLFKMTRSGTDIIKIMDDKVGDYIVKDDMIFYENLSDNGKLYKITSTGEERSKMCDLSVNYLNVDESSIYFISENLDTRYIYKIDYSFDILELISDKFEAYSMNVDGGWIYFSGGYGEEGLYKVRIDGTEMTLIDAVDTLFIGIAGDWIFYDNSDLDSDNFGNVYKIKKDGTEKSLAD